MDSPEILNYQYTIEAASPEDAEGIFNVQRLTWIDTYPNDEAGITHEAVRVRVEGESGELIPTKVERWRNTILEKSRNVFVAKSADKIIGFTAPYFDKENNQFRIGALYVLPEAQGAGVGRKLLQRALEEIGDEHDVYLHVAAYNDNAINFYEKNGFIKTGNDATGSVAPLADGKSIPEIEMVRPAVQPST